VTDPPYRPSLHRPIVIIPTFNNAGTLPGILQRVQALALPIIVVDDGSTDQTKQILAAVPIQALRHDRNRGKAAAMQTGFAAAIAGGYTHAVTIDSDGQLDPEQIPDLLSVSRRHPRALVLGVRDDRRPDYPARSRFGRRFSNAMVYLETGVRISDSQCGFRVYPLDALALLPCGAGRFGYETEVITRASWAGCELEQVPVNCRYFQQHERVTHFKPIRDSLRSLLMHARLLVSAGSPRSPAAWRAAGDPAPSDPGRTEWALAGVALLLGLVLRVVYASNLSVNSDEPQHRPRVGISFLPDGVLIA